MVADLETHLLNENMLVDAAPRKIPSFYEDHHWHSGRLLDLDGLKEREETKDPKTMRKYQKEVRFMEQYAKSLRGGKLSVRDLVIVTDIQDEKKDDKKGKGKKIEKKTNW